MLYLNLQNNRLGEWGTEAARTHAHTGWPVVCGLRGSLLLPSDLSQRHYASINQTPVPLCPGSLTCLFILYENVNVK